MADHKKKSLGKRIIWAGVGLIVLGAIAVYFIFAQKFEDTKAQEAAYNMSAMDLIKAFQKDNALANEKFAEKIIVVNGRVSETEKADSAINIKMIDTLTNAYIIFAFQEQHLAEAATLQVGDSISIKGSCSGGTYSEILDTESINFKRCALNQ